MTERFRALTPFDGLTIGLRTFRISTDLLEPHLRAGEYAVVDPSDREIQHGELYLIQWQQGRREVLQVTSDELKFCGQPGPSPCWWLWIIPKEGDGPFGLPDGCGTADGPYRDDEQGRAHLQSQMLGRVIGYSSTALDRSALLASEGEPTA
jgi:hypothetical protein